MRLCTIYLYEIEQHDSGQIDYYFVQKRDHDSPTILNKEQNNRGSDKMLFVVIYLKYVK